MYVSLIDSVYLSAYLDDIVVSLAISTAAPSVRVVVVVIIIIIKEGTVMMMMMMMEWME